MRKLVGGYADEFRNQFESTVLPFVSKLSQQGYFPCLNFTYSGLVPKRKISYDDMWEFLYKFEKKIGDFEDVNRRFETYDEKTWVFEFSSSYGLQPSEGKVKVPTERKMRTLSDLVDEYESDITFLTLFFYDEDGNRRAIYFCPEDTWEIW